MENLIEVRWHGRGGQGAVTASKILAEAALAEGKKIQAFPEYGPERSGAPVKSFTRIADIPITIHNQVTNPRYVVVLDDTLLSAVDVTEGVPDDGVIVVNTPKSAEEITKEINAGSCKVMTVDATSISIEKLGRNIPNTPMIGALIKATGVIKIDTVLEEFKESYAGKFNEKVIKGNLEAIKAAYESTK